MCFTANFMATNSPKSIDLQEVRGCFNKLGSVWPGGILTDATCHRKLLPVFELNVCMLK